MTIDHDVVDEVIDFSEEMVFCEEDMGTEVSSAAPWTILIVDDDDSIHQATEMALNGAIILDRHIKIINANSRADGFNKFMEHKDEISLVLIDVIMESNTAGLDLVRDIRAIPCGKDVRLIVRTGQPGMAVESDVLFRYDINGYMLKTEVTRSKLLSFLTTGLRDRETIRSLITQVKSIEKLLCESPELFNKYLSSKDATIM